MGSPILAGDGLRQDHPWLARQPSIIRAVALAGSLALMAYIVKRFENA